MKLSIAANCWPLARQQQQQQIDALSKLPVKRIYLGETVCSTRDRLSPRELLQLSEQFAANGQQLVLSSLNLVANKRDIELTEKLTSLANVTIEANDMAAVALANKNGLPFIAGAALNVYNGATLKWLHDLGMVGFQPPLEMPVATLTELMQQAQDLEIRDKFELELLGWGYPLLAVSARCSSARINGRNRNRCDKVCQSKGLQQADSLNGEPMLLINGTQLHGATPIDLLSHLQQLQQLPVDWLRVAPQDLSECDWIAELADAIERQDHSFAAPLPGSARLWQRQGVGSELCAD